jgi:acyl-CoA dehydrogenase family protein 9
MDNDQRRLAEELLFSSGKKPSFAKKLFFGVFDPHQILPFPSISNEEKARSETFVEAVKQYAEKNVDPVKIDRQASVPDQVIEGLARMGVMGLTVPKEYGGLGMSQYAYCRTTETLASRCASTALVVNVHQSIGLKALLLFGTPEQRSRWLPPLAKGEQLAAFSLTEPNAGSDANGIETRAVYDPTLNIYRINGRKQWTTSGSISQILTVMARTEIDTPQGKQDKITAFLVTPDMPGFKILDPALEKVGFRGTRTANLEFRNMEVPAANILGPPGAGLKVCLTVLDYGRVTFGASCTGIGKTLLKRTIEHAKTRIQFKRPLASFALVKQKIANMSALVYAMDATTYLTAGLIDAGVEDIMLEAAMLKVFASDSLWSVIYDTMQIFGGRSLFTDAPFERAMRDARLNMIGEGSNEVLRAFIGAVGIRDIGMELQGVVEALSSPITSFETLSSFSVKSFRRWGASRVPVNSQHLQKEAAALSKAIRRFGIAVVRVLAKHREDVIERQMTLDRLSTIAMAIYTTTAVISKLDSELIKVRGDAKAVSNDVAIGKYYCHMAMETVERTLNSLFSNYDIDIESLSDQITGVKYP